MVYVIVEIDKNDVGDIVNRLLGTRHRITVVDALQTACGCVTPPEGTEEGLLPAKRTKLEQDGGQPFSTVVSSSKHAPFPHTPITTINSLIVKRTDPSTMAEENFDEDDDEADDSVLNAATTHSILMELVENEANSSGLIQENKPTTMPQRQRRNNGVPYNPGSLFPPGFRDSDDDDEKEEYMEGIDMAVRCMVCRKVIALGTRPANHSTRKYAHARSHGFSDRFECSICQAMFKNKRSIFNHHRTYHDNDPSFRIIDTWSEEAQRELMTMVKQCFPSSNKPFVKRSSGSVPPPEESRIPGLIPTIQPNNNESTMDRLFRSLGKVETGTDIDA